MLSSTLFPTERTTATTKMYRQVRSVTGHHRLYCFLNPLVSATEKGSSFAKDGCTCKSINQYYYNIMEGSLKFTFIHSQLLVLIRINSYSHLTILFCKVV